MNRVLVVDDEKSIRVTLRSFLRAAGYEVETADNAEQALALLSEDLWDVVVTDIVLPGAASGVQLLKAIRSVAPAVQVIMMTGEPTVETAAESVRTGARDYLTKPVTKDAILHAVATAMRAKHAQDKQRRMEADNHKYQENLKRLVQVRTEDLRQALDGTIRAMAATVEFRDPYTAGHQERVADLARCIAQEMELSDPQVLATYYAGIVHDLGKIGVPAEILSSPAKLCPEAMGMVQKHSSSGYHILKRINFPWPIADIVHQHHERLDGSGYPRGLVGDAICIEARILGVADVVEAMANHRPYRPALGIEVALEEITEKRGVLYDAQVVDTCVRLFREKKFQL